MHLHSSRMMSTRFPKHGSVESCVRVHFDSYCCAKGVEGLCEVAFAIHITIGGMFGVAQLEK